MPLALQLVPNVEGFLVWLAAAGFAGAAGWLTLTYLRAAREQPEAPPAPVAPGAEAPPAWLHCEAGPALERGAQRYPLRRGARTVFGGQPRNPGGDTDFYYLSPHDIAREHLVIAWDPHSGRYRAAAGKEAPVRLNGEPLAAGETVPLAEGDRLEAGEALRFRFTLVEIRQD